MESKLVTLIICRHDKPEENGTLGLSEGACSFFVGKFLPKAYNIQAPVDRIFYSPTTPAKQTALLQMLGMSQNGWSVSQDKLTEKQGLGDDTDCGGFPGAFKEIIERAKSDDASVIEIVTHRPQIEGILRKYLASQNSALTKEGAIGFGSQYVFQAPDWAAFTDETVKLIGSCSSSREFAAEKGGRFMPVDPNPSIFEVLWLLCGVGNDDFYENYLEGNAYYGKASCRTQQEQPGRLKPGKGNEVPNLLAELHETYAPVQQKENKPVTLIICRHDEYDGALLSSVGAAHSFYVGCLLQQAYGIQAPVDYVFCSCAPRVEITALAHMLGMSQNGWPVSLDKLTENSNLGDGSGGTEALKEIIAQSKSEEASVIEVVTHRPQIYEILCKYLGSQHPVLKEEGAIGFGSQYILQAPNWDVFADALTNEGPKGVKLMGSCPSSGEFAEKNEIPDPDVDLSKSYFWLEVRDEVNFARKMREKMGACFLRSPSEKGGNGLSQEVALMCKEIEEAIIGMYPPPEPPQPVDSQKQTPGQEPNIRES